MVTAEEFERMPDNESALDELDEGEIVTKPFRTMRDGAVSAQIIIAVGNYAKEYHLGKGLAARTGFRL